MLVLAGRFPPPLLTEVATPKPPLMVPWLTPVSAGLAAQPAKNRVGKGLQSFLDEISIMWDGTD